jgi:hypothetical protein
VSGCQYDVALSVPPGVPALEQDEIAQDANTCTMTVVEGVPMDAADTASSTSSRSVGPEGASGSSLLGPTQTSKGQYDTWVEDPHPLGLHVTEAWSVVGWQWGGSGGQAFWNPRNPDPDGGDEACWSHTDALQQTGWQRTAFDVNCNRNDADPQYVETATKAHWKNGLFCVTLDTDVDFNRARGRGWYDGTLQGLTTYSIYGGCSGLLSFHHRVDRLVN